MSEIVGRYVTIRGRRAYFETCGHGPRILLLSMAARDSRQWHEVMERLAAQFTLTSVDLPGHGKSQTFPQHALLSDVREIATWLGEFTQTVFGSDRFALMGCSLGGNLSLLMAAMFPEAVIAAVPLQGADHTPSLSPQGLAARFHPQINPLPSSLEFCRSLLGSQTTEEGYELAFWLAKTGDAFTSANDLTAYTLCDVRDLMANVVCPVLLVHGDEDWIVPRERVDATAGRLINAVERRVISMPGLAHTPHIEDPARLVAVTRPFLEQYVMPNGT
jgi:pimeloyl-ACP methyl ester carboxylesterase